ncbi:SDR family oxidoreductase [Exilibacterium tricleocarpae]|uniref:SDR family oxidoreductase n=1 Tax=Exilibacterium tricleocarpae TaxID=2591008 RepID=UPI0015D36689|nr:SDR family oxidoreductase [Exilibacterium tricleocarpae]
MSVEKLLIVGCGDLGRRLARRLDPAAFEVHGLRRSDTALPAPIHAVSGDVSERAPTAALLRREAYDVVVATLTPDARSDTGYRRAYVDTMTVLTSELAALSHPPRLVIFVSSTSVYGQNAGEWVDESAPTRPQSFSGRRLLEAERCLLDSGLPGCVVRFSGIYGRGRARLVQQVRDGAGACQAPPQYSNRIHAEDCAGVLQHLMALSRRPGSLAPVYVASDCDPAPLWDVKQWLAGRLGLPPDHLQPSASRGQGKRCSNRLLLSTGYRFQYPDYRSGYGAELDESQNPRSP